MFPKFSLLLALAASPALAHDAVLDFDRTAALAAASPSQISTGVPHTFDSAKDGHWSHEGDVSTWTYSAQVRGATSVNPWFDTIALPEGVSLTINGMEHADLLRGWDRRSSEIFRGDTVTIEARVPAAALADFHLVGKKILAGFRGAPGVPTKALEGYGPEDYQNYNYECLRSFETEAQAAATVRMYFEDAEGNAGGGCTATWVNNTRNDGRPYLLTAAHCTGRDIRVNNDPRTLEEIQEFVGTARLYPESSAPCGNVRGSSMFWGNDIFYNEDYRAISLAGGTARARQDDALLIEWNVTPPAEVLTVFAGVAPVAEESGARLDNAGRSFFGITHANAGGRQYYGVREAYQGYNGQRDYIDTVYVQGTQWASGGGSSGSGLFDQSNRVYGVGSTGSSPEGCLRPQPAEEGSDSAQGGCLIYAGLSRFWNNTAPENSLSYWLAPDRFGNPPALIEPYAIANPPPIVGLSANSRMESDREIKRVTFWSNRADSCTWLGQNNPNAGQLAVANEFVRGSTMQGFIDIDWSQRIPGTGDTGYGIECENAGGTYKVFEGDENAPTPIPTRPPATSPTPVPVATPTPAPSSEPRASKGSGSLGGWVALLLIALRKRVGR